MIYHFTLAIQLVVSFYWLLTKSRDFLQLIKQIDSFAAEFSCEKPLAKHIKHLDLVFSFIVSPAMCVLAYAELCTYEAVDFLLLQLLENCYGCAIAAIWQWKVILLASAMRVVTSKLNLHLKVPILM
jgi:hypothetical protein